MNMDAYERLTAETRRRGTRFDALIGVDEVEGSDEEEEERAGVSDEVPCPFCGEEFDDLGMYCHFEGEHNAEANAGVCPICTNLVGINLVGHITSQHRGFLKDKWRNQRGSSGSHCPTLALLKKDLHERTFSGSSFAASVSTVPDPLLSSFVGNFFEEDLPNGAQEESLDETEVESEPLEHKVEESIDEPLLPEVKKERTRRSQFVQGLILSLMFDDIL